MNKDKRNNIKLLGTLNNADESGIIANASQIYDDVQQKAQETINSELIAAVGTEGSVDTRITNAVNVEKTRAEGAESTLDGKIAAEQTRAANAENALDGRVDTLEEAVGTGGSVDSRIASAVATETSRAQEAEANRYTKNETYTKEEVNNLITTPNQEYVSVTATDQTTAVTDVLPAIGLADTIYRVGNWDGSQYDVTKYSEYAWNSRDYVHLSTKTQIGEVFDISAYHATGGTLATYDDLEDALGTNGANVPQSLRKGGMSIKFVRTSDNKYVQYRLRHTNWTTDVAYWVNIEEILNNQITDIKNNIATVSDGPGDFSIQDEAGNILCLWKDGHIKTKNFDSKETLQVIDRLKNNPGSLNDVYLQEDTLDDFSIKDENGNAIVVFNKGHIKTKNFDSSKTDNSSPSVTVEKELPTPVIFDTDWMDDVDDAVALRVLLWAERQGMIDIVGINIDSVISTSAKSLSCFLNYEGRQGLCIGLEKEITGISSSSKYHSVCINDFPYYDYRSNDSCEDSVTFYRRALSKIEQKVNIILVGFPTSLYRLLQSSSDSHSSLGGIDLVKEKVNRIYFMGGGYPTYTNENNLARNTTIANCSDYILKNCPVPIVFLGFEVGNSVVTGNTLSNSIGKDDLLYKCLDSYGASTGRSSWDPMLTLLACIDNPEAAGYSVTVGTNSVDTSTLVNTFITDPNGTHSYVTKRHPDSYYTYMINNIIEKRAWKYRKLGEQSLNIL